jgi:uncharacterized membrane protein YcaP (DUF421 family)
MVKPEFSDQFELSLGTVGAVGVAVLCMYLTCVVVVRLGGPRLLMVSTAWDVAFVASMGAILGRTVLLRDPTIVAGVAALVTFAFVHAVAVRARHSLAFRGVSSRAPMLIVADGHVLPANLRRARLSEDDVRRAMRASGVGSLTVLRSLVLEQNGSFTAIRTSEPLDAWVMADVVDPRRHQRTTSRRITQPRPKDPGR